MKDGYRIYDTHAHLGHARHSGRTAAAEDLLRSMDRHGIDRAVLIPFPVVDDFRAEHDLIAAAVRAWPDRFTGTACIYPFVASDVFLQEIRRCSEELGFKAIKLQPQYQPLNPISPRSSFFFEAASRHHLVVVCHTGTGVPFSLPSLLIVPARQFPDVTFVIGHAGGSVYVSESIVAATVCPNIYIELSSLMPHHLLEVLSHVPAGRLMAGSDLPESIGVEFGKILTLDIPEEARRQILWTVPRRVFDGSTE